jgi:hypothetical protein
MTQVRFAYLSLGDRHDILARAWLSILTVLAYAPPNSQIAIVTDQPARFAWFGGRLEIITIDPATVQEWRGRHDFFWRVKLMSVLRLAELGPAHLIYLDTDVLVRKPLNDLVQALEAGDVFMHEREYDLSNSRRSGQVRLWKMVRGLTTGGLTVGSPCVMWNAGLVAVGAQQIDLLKRALETCDGLMDQGVQHALTEQLSFSLTLGSTGRIREGKAWMDHFWSNKDGYGAAIDRQLAHILIDRLDVDSAIAYVRANPILLPLVVRKRWWSKLLLRAAGVPS